MLRTPPHAARTGTARARTVRAGSYADRRDHPGCPRPPIRLRDAARAHPPGPPDDPRAGRDLARRGHCELDFTTPLELVVATILSAQSTDRGVNLVTPALFAKYPTAADYAAADRAELEEMIHSTGFFRNKATALIGLGQALVERFGGEVPRTLDELVTLPGIGRKTANVILGEAFRLPGHHRRHALRPAGPALAVDRRRPTRSRSSARSPR